MGRLDGGVTQSVAKAVTQSRVSPHLSAASHRWGECPHEPIPHRLDGVSPHLGSDAWVPVYFPGIGAGAIGIVPRSRTLSGAEPSVMVKVLVPFQAWLGWPSLST